MGRRLSVFVGRGPRPRYGFSPAANGPTRTRALLRSNVLTPMPCTLIRSRGFSNPPLASRHATIFAAVLGPTFPQRLQRFDGSRVDVDGLWSGLRCGVRGRRCRCRTRFGRWLSGDRTHGGRRSDGRGSSRAPASPRAHATAAARPSRVPRRGTFRISSMEAKAPARSRVSTMARAVTGPTPGSTSISAGRSAIQGPGAPPRARPPRRAPVPQATPLPTPAPPGASASTPARPAPRPPERSAPSKPLSSFRVIPPYMARLPFASAWPKHTSDAGKRSMAFAAENYWHRGSTSV